MAGLPHYDHSKASKNLYEPVHQNLFEVTFIKSDISGGEMLLEHVNSVSGLDTIHPEISEVTQKYKFSSRSYVGMPSDGTTAKIEIEFSLNLNDANQMYVYKTLLDWAKQSYNPATGEMGLKKDYVGDIIIVQYNRAGDIYRKISLPDSFIASAPTGLDENNYDSSEPVTITASFICDHPSEELA